MSGDVTRILRALESGESQASEDLFPIIYQELRTLASRRMGSERPDDQACEQTADDKLRLGDAQRTNHRSG